MRKVLPMTVRQRIPRIHDKEFLKFVRSHACAACGCPPPSQAAHIRYSDAASGNINPGIGAKPDDSKTVPLCADCHLDAPDAQHNVGEKAFWKRVGINPFELAANLYAQFERRRNRPAEVRDAVVARAVRMKRRRAKKAAHNGVHKSGAKKAKRPIKSANRWPLRGTQKIRSAPFRAR